eukprot:3700170-Prymnesium_polylepis.1
MQLCAASTKLNVTKTIPVQYADDEKASASALSSVVAAYLQQQPHPANAQRAEGADGGEWRAASGEWRAASGERQGAA